MVLMIFEQVISQTRKMLVEKTKISVLESQVHSLTFALRISSSKLIQEVGLAKAFDEMTGGVVYGGYPEVAALGYKIATSKNKNSELLGIFLDGVRRQKGRSIKALEALSLDDIALLGFAEGLLIAKKEKHSLDIDDLQQWVLELINLEPKRKIWTSRLRDLAGDLLDRKGRLRGFPELDDVNAASLEIVIRNAWPEFQSSSDALPLDVFEDLLSNLIKYVDPKAKQIEEVIVQLMALDLLVEQNSKYLFVKTDAAISLLINVKKRIDMVALRNTKLSISLWFLLIVIVNVAYFLVREQLSLQYQDRLDIFVPSVSFLSGYLYQVLAQKEFSPKEIFFLILEKQKKKLYKKWGFDIEQFDKL